MLPLSPTPTPQDLLDSSSNQWNPYVLSPIIVVFAVILTFSYYRILKRVCCELNALNLSRNQVTMRRVNENNFEDPSIQNHSHGLESAVMYSLPISQFKEKEEEEPQQSNNECAICLGEFEEGEWLKHLPSCAHVFHVACIDTWFQTHSNCPLCRCYINDLRYECSSMNTLLENLREDFFHQTAELSLLDISEHYAHT